METNALTTLNNAKQNFALALQDAQSLDLVNNMASAFDAAIIVNRLEEALTDEVMNTIFMPLMNKRTGFLTDRDPNKPNRNGIVPKPYPVSVVRTAIIDAAMIGLQPVGNQFNIISGSMYPAKNGFTAILQRLKKKNGLVYNFEFDPEAQVKSADPSFMAIPCRISYRTNREDLKGWFKYVAMVKINGETSSTDQLRGKAERKCKKSFVEFLTGLDLGDADAGETVDVTYTEVSTTAAPQSAAPTQSTAAAPQSTVQKAREIINKRNPQPQTQPQRVGDIMGDMGMTDTTQSTSPAPQPAAPTPQPDQQPPAPANGIQPNLNFDNMSDEEIEHMVDSFMGEEGGEQ